MSHSMFPRSCRYLFQQHAKINRHLVPAAISCCHRRTLWDRSFEWTEDIRAKLTERYDFSRMGYETYEKRKFRKKIREGQKFAKDVYDKIGPDLYASTFIMTRGGSVKFAHDDIWYSESTASNIPVPPKEEGYRVEGIDAADMIIMLEGMDSLRNLKHLRYLRLKNMFELEDWHLFTLHKFESLEFVDVSNNPRITDRGIESLYTLRELKVVDVSNCPGIENGELVTACLQHMNPDLTVIGLDPELSLQENFVLTELRNSRFLHLGTRVPQEEGEELESHAEGLEVNNSAQCGAHHPAEGVRQDIDKDEENNSIAKSLADKFRKAMFRDVK